MADSFHTEDVTQVRFNPNNSWSLHTGSVDGTICQFALTSSNLSALDDALDTVLNTDQPVSRLGFFGPDSDFLYSLSTVETLSLWHLSKAQRIADFSDIRHKLSSASGLEITYLIDCHYQPSSQRLFISAGNAFGTVTISHVNITELETIALVKTPKASVQTSQSITEYTTTGHTATIRDILWIEQLLVTGGEDSKLCVWTSPQSSLPCNLADDSKTMHHSIPAKSKTKDVKYRPY